jgi:hypothetical protein
VISAFPKRVIAELFRSRSLVNMQTFDTTNSKVARRCRYDQHHGKKTTVTVEGSSVTGMVRSVIDQVFGSCWDLVNTTF